MTNTICWCIRKVYNQCYGSTLVLLRIQIQHFRSMRIRFQFWILIQDFDYQIF
jgi:hypothetical protein